ncbi:nuclear factor erythroid 2-related factor 3 [Microtus ochrogaster]|uniref:Nuclear factor erythroid 2-related factor 3 n=1 Tax=Microtus ochrogaster TaxID=79684 RepID=A0ABM0LI79_MICOH|nr:nuclear factor erythroid 2-related factor 3 [Microtus ochrogaster]
MKLQKPWWAGGGLLNLTVLLSLARLRVDLDLCLPQPAAALCEELLPLCPTRPACASSPFSASEGWGHSPELLAKGRLLREVRALGVPFVPRTRVDAWLVHSVATGDADGAHGLLGTAASSAVGDGGQAAPAGGGDPRETHSSPLAAEEEEEKAAEPTAQVQDTGGRESQENDILKEKSETVDHSSQHEEDEEGVSAHAKSLQLGRKDESKTDAPAWEGGTITESRNENHLHRSDTSFFLEDLFQLLSSQPEHSLEGISLEDIPPSLNSINASVNSSAHHINLSHAISHDVNLHEAMLLCPITFRRDPAARISQAQEPFLQLNSHTNSEQAIPAMSLPTVDNQMRTLTGQDLLYDTDSSIFDGINLMSLATGFNPLEVSQLFEDPDSDSGISLNSSYNTSITKSNSSHCMYDGAVGYSSDLESLSHDLGAVGGCCPEHCHMDIRTMSGFYQDLECQQVFHDHTYHLQPGVPESLTQSKKSQKISGCLDSDRNLSRDEQRAKALHIPFSVDEIVHMPVDSFNSMLSRHYLSDLQVSLIRDIRRRGKNKVAAQNCRKRKLDIILNLEDDICNLQTQKEALKNEQNQCNKAIDIMKQKLHELYYDVFSRLIDDQGRPVNPNHYALQYNNDGTVLIVPKELVTSGHKKKAPKGKRKN